MLLHNLVPHIRIKHIKLNTLLCDNFSHIMLLHNPVLYIITKHIKLNIHFVRERLDVNKLIIQHVRDPIQTIDILTKPLYSIVFLDQKIKFELVSLPPR